MAVYLNGEAVGSVVSDWLNEDSFVEKFDGSKETGDLKSTVYGQDLGTQKNIPYSKEPKSLALAQYSSDGTLKVSTPKSDNDAVSKKHLEDNYLAKNTTVSGNRVYVSKTNNGTINNTTVEYANEAKAETIALRDANGGLKGYCTKDSSNDTLTTKEFVDGIAKSLSGQNEYVGRYMGTTYTADSIQSELSSFVQTTAKRQAKKGDLVNIGEAGVGVDYSGQQWIYDADTAMWKYYIDFENHSVIDNLVSESSVDSLSARQGKVLNDKFDNYALKTDIVNANYEESDTASKSYIFNRPFYDDTANGGSLKVIEDKYLDLANRETIKTIDGKVKVLDSNLKALDGEVDTLSANHQELETIVENLGNSLKNADNNVSVLDTNLKTLDEDVDILREAHNATDAEVDVLKEKQDTLTNELNTSNENINTINNKVNDLTNNLNTLDNKVDIRVNTFHASIDNSNFRYVKGSADFTYEQAVNIEHCQIEVSVANEKVYLKKQEYKNINPPDAIAGRYVGFSELIRVAGEMAELFLFVYDPENLPTDPASVENLKDWGDAQYCVSSYQPVVMGNFLDTDVEAERNNNTNAPSTKAAGDYTDKKCGVVLDYMQTTFAQNIMALVADTYGPHIIYNDPTGFESSNDDAGDTWHLTGLNLSPYKRIKCYVCSGGDGDANYSPEHIVEVHLDDRAKGSFGYFTSDHAGHCPNNRNRHHIVTFTVNAAKTAIQFQHSISIYGTAASNSSGGRRCYLIEGYKV